MSYPSDYEHVDPATGARYVWDGEQWLRRDDAQMVPHGAAQQAPAAPIASYASPQPQYSPPYPQTVAGPAYVSDKSSRNIQAIIAWILTLVTFGYMLPWAIAATRGKSNAGMIGILDLSLAWTIIGCIVALVMACGAHQIMAAAPSVSVVTAVGVHNAYPYPAPNGYAQPAQNPNVGLFSCDYGALSGHKLALQSAALGESPSTACREEQSEPSGPTTSIPRRRLVPN